MLGGEGCNAWEVNTIDLKSALTLHPMETLSLKASRVFSPHSCRFLDSQEQLSLTHTHDKMLRESSQTVHRERADSVSMSICKPDQSLNHLSLSRGAGMPKSSQYTLGPKIVIGIVVLSYSLPSCQAH